MQASFCLVQLPIPTVGRNSQNDFDFTYSINIRKPVRTPLKQIIPNVYYYSLEFII